MVLVIAGEFVINIFGAVQDLRGMEGGPPNQTGHAPTTVLIAVARITTAAVTKGGMLSKKGLVPTPLYHLPFGCKAVWIFQPDRNAGGCEKLLEKSDEHRVCRSCT